MLSTSVQGADVLNQLFLLEVASVVQSSVWLPYLPLEFTVKRPSGTEPSAVAPLVWEGVCCQLFQLNQTQQQNTDFSKTDFSSIQYNF